MRKASDSIATARPKGTDLELLEHAAMSARRGRLPVEVRLGVGPINGRLPLRVLGHAACVQDLWRADLPAFVQRVGCVHIFGSAPKVIGLAGGDDKLAGEEAIRGVAALAGALRLAGLRIPISVDATASFRELPDAVHSSVELPGKIGMWLQNAAAHNSNGADPKSYAVEHAAPSMFGDVAEQSEKLPLRITVGAKPEAAFWAVRIRVREAARTLGLPLAPSFGIILRTCERPWYSATEREPLFSELLFKSPAEVEAQLFSATNQDRGGNSGLRREARAAKALIAHPGAKSLALATMTAKDASRFLDAGDFQIGDRLAAIMRKV